MVHYAKKSLGQNFLKSESALRMMCEAGKVSAEDTVIEIGPGKGALTVKLLERASKVIAIEKDRDLLAILKDRFASEIEIGKLHLIEGDILEFDPKALKLKSGEYKIVANIPYNITGAIIKRFLSETAQPSSMTLLVQKEVAMRIVARDAKESILSISVKAYGTTAYIMKVNKRFFSPSPKVDSAIVSISNISKNNFKNLKEEQQFFTIVKAGFAHKRKVLKKNLEVVASSEQIENLFKELSLPLQARAEDLPLEKWLAINRYLKEVI